MKLRPPLPSGPFLVIGLARSGAGIAEALRARGEEVIGCDAGASDDPRLRAVAEGLSAQGVEVHLDASGDVFAARAGTLVKSPGVPQSATAVMAARARAVPVVGELELAWRLLGNEFIAVTGTNGKTTTTEWIGHIHREAGAPAAVAGNVGTPLSSLIGDLAPDVTVIAECSSFQLEDSVAFAPEAATLLNLAPDHLDRHGTFAAYVAAKLRVFVNQGNDDIAVIPDDLGVDDIGGCARVVAFGATPAAELAERAGHLWWNERPLLRTGEISLPGAHNRQNAMAAAAICLARGLDADAVMAGLTTFRGVAHRLELIATVGGVAYVNDSKATNVASTIVALEAYPQGVHLIAGGRGKQQDFSPLGPVAARRCSGVYLIGEAAGDIARDIAGAMSAAGVALHDAGDLASALARAARAARPGEVVLLSPACASFDQYPNFEARGDHFRTLVQGLEG